MEMNENHEIEPAFFPAELVEIVPASGWQFEQMPPVLPVRQRRIKVPIALFIATCLSTFMVGMIEAEPQDTWMQAIIQGLQYAVPLMTILICHEMGHFIQAWRNGVYASLPFFIPVPLPPLGTMGAVIAMEARMGHRRALFDIGITGPLAGLVPTIIFCVWGIKMSTVEPIVRHLNETHISTPLLFEFLSEWLGKSLTAGYAMNLHPMAFAGWVGLLITSVNLFPIGQLDGGHVLYALLRKKANVIARILLAVAACVTVYYWQYLYMWTLMIFLLFMIGPTHPPTADDEEPLGWPRIILGWLTLAFIPIGFTPMPFIIGQ
jgi:membrane-associated protease RseP (regulator of RpoE activity)